MVSQSACLSKACICTVCYLLHVLYLESFCRRLVNICIHGVIRLVHTREEGALCVLLNLQFVSLYMFYQSAQSVSFCSIFTLYITYMFCQSAQSFILFVLCVWSDCEGALCVKPPVSTVY